MDAHSGYHLWSEQYDRDVRDLFAVQDEIAHAIVSALRVRLAGEPPPTTVSAEVTERQTYLLYLQGRFAWHQRNYASLQRAVELYQTALARDPRYALAYAGLGDVYAVLPLYGTMRADSAYGLAEQAARRALALDSTLASRTPPSG